jgi:hypothetical protein
MEEVETPKPHDGVALQKEGSSWMEKIQAAENREHEWRKDAEAAEKAYAGDTKATNGKLYDFNILHSNVETIVPAIYNSTPIPDVRRRWTEAESQPPQPPQVQEGQQPDPRAVIAFQQAMQQYQAKAQFDKDAKDYGYMVERAITVQIDDNKLDTEIEREAQDAFLAGRGIIRVKLQAEFNGDQPANESLSFEAVSWRNFRMGPAKRWEDVPWEAFRHSLPRETLEKHTNKEMLNSQVVAADKLDDNEDDIVFWEIWDKDAKKVKFVREHDCKMLNIVDDPLGLKGFYPNPEPVQPIVLTGKMTPVCPFSIYRKLADELDLITQRINKIMKGLKVRGLVIGDASKLMELADADDNQIITVTDIESLAQTGGLDKAITWWPVEQAIKVLSELYKQRESVKQSIYEITGISDIVRGASSAQETATAQQIKTQWGSLRIQKMQRLIERQVRDVFCLMAELITSKFSEQTLQQMTAVQITDGIRALMQQPVLASYRVDVESDSTVRADLTRQKQDMTEFLTGTANYFGTMGPLLASAPEAAEPVAEIYASMARVFKLGREAEDALETLKNIAKKSASKPRPNPEAEKAKAEMAMKQQDAQMKAQAAELELQLKTKEFELKQADGQAKIQIEREKAQIELQIATINLQMKQAEMAMKEREAELSLRTKVAESAIKIDSQQKSAAIKASQTNGKQERATQ